jgi:hypothetical protein
MRHIVEAGTDAAGVALFDPGALPADFDSRVQDDPIELFETLQRDGKAFYTETGGDGRYLLHAYVDEPVPGNLQEHLREPVIIERLAVPNGRLYFTGSEYAFRQDDGLLKQYPHMGAAIEVPAGEYRLTISRAAYPANHLENLLREEVGPVAFQLHQNMPWFATFAVAAVIALVVGYFAIPREDYLLYLLPASVIVVALPFIVVRLKQYQEARERFAAIQREYPAMVARLERHT